MRYLEKSFKTNFNKTERIKLHTHTHRYICICIYVYAFVKHCNIPMDNKNW